MAKKLTFYKILTKNNKPANDGVCTYSLPTKNKPGQWMPSEKVNPCYSGYHVVTAEYVPSWLTESGNVYIAEGRGTHMTHGSKHVFESIRLIKKVGQLPEYLDQVGDMTGEECLKFISNSRLVNTVNAERAEFKKIRRKIMNHLTVYETANSSVDSEESFATGYVLAHPVYKKMSKAKRERLIKFFYQ